MPSVDPFARVLGDRRGRRRGPFADPASDEAHREASRLLEAGVNVMELHRLVGEHPRAARLAVDGPSLDALNTDAVVRLLLCAARHLCDDAEARYSRPAWRLLSASGLYDTHAGFQTGYSLVTWEAARRLLERLRACDGALGGDPDWQAMDVLVGAALDRLADDAAARPDAALRVLTYAAPERMRQAARAQTVAWWHDIYAHITRVPTGFLPEPGQGKFAEGDVDWRCRALADYLYAQLNHASAGNDA